MLQFKNQTPLAGKMFVTPNPEGIDCLYTVLKGTFTLGKKVVPAENPLPIVDKEEYIDRPGQSSVKTPSDFALVKPGTDVLLMGTAYAPGGKPATQLDVSLQAGPIKKTVRVFGDRVWEARLLGTKISATHSTRCRWLGSGLLAAWIKPPTTRQCSSRKRATRSALASWPRTGRTEPTE